MPGNWQGMVLHRGHEELAIIIVMLQCECILLARATAKWLCPETARTVTSVLVSSVCYIYHYS